MSGKKEILKVQKNKNTGQKYVNIPKSSEIEVDDYVKVEVVEL
jgi:hypothetical protein